MFSLMCDFYFIFIFFFIVCSTTLWLGHVPKSCSEVDISNTFGEFGTILSIDVSKKTTAKKIFLLK